jgi:hypothetical protein
MDCRVTAGDVSMGRKAFMGRKVRQNGEESLSLPKYVASCAGRGAVHCIDRQAQERISAAPFSGRGFLSSD